jgi:RNA polymerase sigma-70 factor, ECF subfamily
MAGRPHTHRNGLTPDEAARVAEVFESHKRFVENVARQHAARPDDVPDIVQAVGMKVCKGLNGFRGESELTTWLYRVTVSTACDHFRNEQRQTRAIEAVMALRTRESTTVEPMMDPDQAAIVGERLDAVQAALGRMRSNHRATILERIRNHYGQGTVEPDGQIPEGTRKSRLFRARRQLRNHLAQDSRFN